MSGQSPADATFQALHGPRPRIAPKTIHTTIGGGRKIAGISEGSGSFLKKRTKKLLFLWRLHVALSSPHPMSQVKKVFLLLFVHKKKCFLPLPFPSLPFP
jgi:hypothetical protein